MVGPEGTELGLRNKTKQNQTEAAVKMLPLRLSADSWDPAEVQIALLQLFGLQESTESWKNRNTV